MTHQCLYIAKILLSGRTYSKQESMRDYIGSVHSRIRTLSGWIDQQYTGHRTKEIGYYILNIGSTDGHKQANGNRCAIYKLPVMYRRYLKAALKRRGMLA